MKRRTYSRRRTAVRAMKPQMPTNVRMPTAFDCVSYDGVPRVGTRAKMTGAISTGRATAQAVSDQTASESLLCCPPDGRRQGLKIVPGLRKEKTKDDRLSKTFRDGG